MENITIKCVKGKEIIPYISDLAQLRIVVFKDYPYLYEGNLEYEAHYLQTYVDCPESTMVLVFDHDKVVGVSTAIPLEFETSAWQKPFIENHRSIKDIFYLGESVLLPAYRGKGIYKYFFKEREAAARAYGSKITTFAAVERPDNHPLKPVGYVSLEKIWQKFGYVKHPELSAEFEWLDTNEKAPTFKPLFFWLKILNAS